MCFFWRHLLEFSLDKGNRSCTGFKKPPFLLTSFVCLAVLGLHSFVRAFSIGASYSSLQCVGLSCYGQDSRAHRLSSCGSGAQSLRGLWDLHRPGTQSVHPLGHQEVPLLAFCPLALSASLLQGSASSCSEESISSCLDVDRLY